MKIEYEYEHENLLGFLGKKDIKSSSFFPLLEIGDLRMFAYSTDETIYLIYVMQDRTVRKMGKKLNIQELLFSETDYSNVLDLLSGNVDIEAALKSKSQYRIGKIGKKVFDKIAVKSHDEIKDKIPKVGIKLNREIPNSIDVNLIAGRIVDRKNWMGNYDFNNPKMKKITKSIKVDNKFQTQGDHSNFKELYNFIPITNMSQE